MYEVRLIKSHQNIEEKNNELKRWASTHFLDQHLEENGSY